MGYGRDCVWAPLHTKSLCSEMNGSHSLVVLSEAQIIKLFFATQGSSMLWRTGIKY